jgi:hypothetical protein
VELDLARSRVLLEIRRGIVDAKRHLFLPLL